MEIITPIVLVFLLIKVFMLERKINSRDKQI